MKKVLSMGVLLALMIMFTGCGNQQAITDLQNKVDELQAQVDELSGTVKTLSENMEVLKQELEKKNIVQKNKLKPVIRK